MKNLIELMGVHGTKFALTLVCIYIEKWRNQADGRINRDRLCVIFSLARIMDQLGFWALRALH